MTDIEEILPRIETEIAAFEAEVAKLRELEQKQTQLSAEFAESKALESQILADRTSDAKAVAKKLAEQRAFSDTLSARMGDIENVRLHVYELGAIAAKTLYVASDAFRCKFE